MVAEASDDGDDAREGASEDASEGTHGSAVAGSSLEPARLARAERRDALLDIAAELVATGDAEAVTMEAVAERAGVSRPLVYKHFANRTELLASLYQRESLLLHRELTAAVLAADTLEGKLRALVRGALDAQRSRAATFAALRAAGMRNNVRRDEQRRRDRATLRYFASLAVQDFELDERTARAGLAIILGSIDTVIARWRTRPTEQHARHLEDTYAALAMGGLRELARR